ncbi:ABC transporter permease [Cellvibrio sp. UBA7661]|uniref:ABC transporter permease n=1 Tax=Cellvibrio sp. UBA7661 TaxID=1946311 RepID=UPI002F360353
MLALKLLLRNWRSGELKLLAISLILAVAVLSGISIFSARLESTLLLQSNSILGADAVVSGSVPISQKWIDLATESKLQQSFSTTFMSVVYADDEMQMASIKAVDSYYPLRGKLDTSHLAYAENAVDIRTASAAPAAGEVWVDSRLFSALKVALGDRVSVGDVDLTLTRILIDEPDGVNPFFNFGARLIMNIGDLPKTNIPQENYQWLLAANNGNNLTGFLEKIKPELNQHQSIATIESSQEQLAANLTTAKNFLIIASVMAVLLAGVAIAIAARQFSVRHTNQIALMKSLGTSAIHVRLLYFGQLLILGVAAALFGLMIGFGIQEIVAVSITQLYQITLVTSGVYPYVLSFTGGLVCVLCFALPALWLLPGIPPLKILRRELAVNRPQVWLQIGLALFAMIVLVGLFSRNLKITVSSTLGLLIVLVVACVVSWLLLKISKLFMSNLGGVWRLAFAGMQKRKGKSVVQVAIFSVALMLLLTLTIIRTSFIAEWQGRIPADSPNHFVGNMNAADVENFKQFLLDRGIDANPIYPVVRARIAHINSVEPSEELRNRHPAFKQELHVTDFDSLSSDHDIVAGQWWDLWQKTAPDRVGVSVDAEFAKLIGLNIGDQLAFSVGGLALNAEVANFRRIDWKSLNQNFLFIFEPTALDRFSPIYGTSVFIPTGDTQYFNHFVREHPNLMILNFGSMIENIQILISQVSNGIGLVLWLTLGAGCLVLFAAVMGSIDSRKQEAGLLRALGSSRHLILGSVLIEFAVLGFLSGLIAIVGAESFLYALQYLVFKNEMQPHYVYWFASPLIGMVFIAMLGVVCCRSVVVTPPAVVLREAA